MWIDSPLNVRCTQIIHYIPTFIPRNVAQFTHFWPTPCFFTIRVWFFQIYTFNFTVSRLFSVQFRLLIAFDPPVCHLTIQLLTDPPVILSKSTKLLRYDPNRVGPKFEMLFHCLRFCRKNTHTQTHTIHESTTNTIFSRLLSRTRGGAWRIFRRRTHTVTKTRVALH